MARQYLLKLRYIMSSYIKLLVIYLLIFAILTIRGAAEIEWDVIDGVVLKPEESGNWTLIVKNINEDYILKNLSVNASIISFGAIDPEKPIMNILFCPQPPKFGNSLSATKKVDVLLPKNSIELRAKIETNSITTEGIYYIKIVIQYDIYDARDQYIRHEVLYPMSSFSVVKPPNILPLYVLLCASVFFGILSVLLWWKRND